MIENALLLKLLATYGSPLYVYDGDRFWQNLQAIPQQVGYPLTTYCFASVTNGNISLLQIAQKSGWGIHANTPGDIYLGLNAGFSPDQIIYSGSNLSRQDIAQVLDWGVSTFNLDSLCQLEQLCEMSLTIPDLRLGLRLNDPSLTAESRIGVQPQEFAIAVAIAERFGRQIQGLHFYRGTGTNVTKAFTVTIDRLLTLGKTLPHWQYLDFGGGFGYPYRHGKAAFEWTEFGQAISQKLEGTSIHLILEPGRNVIAECGILMTTVVAVKYQGEKQIVGVDTTIANLTAPNVYGDYRQIIALQENDKQVITDVCGNTTYSGDYLGRNINLPPLQRGDTLAILDVGAYGYAMSSHFLHRPKPAEVLIKGSDHYLIREREDYSVLLSKQISMK
ncbi:decarboxylase [Pseudanabaena sp. BC1403]|uniref:diaminopimelate decarboxylase family protein n=1 Tax=Pseudanabaena sp. BC1403 TaxID=2043171 RepID=UPI000CD825A7|nr:decarboxylase [Pseudanabaena sp. BC1403]